MVGVKAANCDIIRGDGKLPPLYRRKEYHDDVWGAETTIYEAGRSKDVEGDYEAQISREILSWPEF